MYYVVQDVFIYISEKKVYITRNNIKNSLKALIEFVL